MANERYVLGILGVRGALNHNFNGDDIILATIYVKCQMDFLLFRKMCEFAFAAYPQLSSTLHYDRESDYYYLLNNNKFDNIDINYRKIASLEKWEAIANEFLLIPFEVEKSLWAVTLLEAEENNFIILFKSHHAISDGRSIAHLLINDFPHFYNTLKNTIDAPLPEAKKMISRPEQYAQLNAFSVKPKVRQNVHYQEPFLINTPLNQRRAKNYFFNFNINPIVNLCAKLNTKLGVNKKITINDFFSTIMVISMLKYKKQIDERAAINLATCVDLRKKYGLSAETFGCIYEAVVNNFTIKDFASFVDFNAKANFIHDEVHAAIANQTAPPLITKKTEIDTILGINQQAQANCFQTCIAASNIGKLPIIANSEFKIKAFFFTANQTLADNQILFNIASINKCIYINFSYVSPVCSEAWALGFLRVFFQELFVNVPDLILNSCFTSRPIIELVASLHLPVATSFAQAQTAKTVVEMENEAPAAGEIRTFKSF